MIKIAVAATAAALGLAYLALTKPRPPNVCGSPCGLPVTSPRVKLRHAKCRVLYSAAAEETPSLHRVANSNTKTKESSGEPSKFICAICFDEKPMPDRFKYSECNHIFCVPCMTKYAATQMHQNILKIICPNPNCSSELKPIHFQTSLPLEVIDRWETVRCESLIAESQKTYCPFKDCSVLLVDDGGEVVTSAECPSCHRLFCAQCRVPWHGMMTCQEYQNSKRS
ncbi:unnamed protein product [Cuscuta campestris]|uniref:RBR-type E3 ubiquitin transferase n=1 Tax=Cuscuta campestris TaxID=132261 RepID=A0A484M4D9_9ASTE|nr:unnamed protein product [Cuscuta campestris]